MAEISVNDFDDWIAEIADPRNNPNPPRPVITLFGYLSDADEFDPTAADYFTASLRTRYRLYLTPQLDHYLVIHQDDIIYHMRIVAGYNAMWPIGGILLWVKAEAVIENVPLNAHAAQAGFLGGPVTAIGFAQANMSPQSPGGGGSFACPGGGGSFACPGGGASFACPGGWSIFRLPWRRCVVRVSRRGRVARPLPVSGVMMGLHVLPVASAAREL